MTFADKASNTVTLVKCKDFDTDLCESVPHLKKKKY